MRVYLRLLFFTSLNATLLLSCTQMCKKSYKNLSPEEVVETYLNIGLNMAKVSQRDDLIELTTGPLKEALKQASDENIREAYIDRKLVLKEYSVLERRDRTPRETEITFRLKFQDKNRTGFEDTAKDALITAENTVALVRENSAWLIHDVIGTRTTIDFGTNSDSVIRARPGPGLDSPEDLNQEN
jgi:hypothetical protein